MKIIRANPTTTTILEMI